MRTYTIVGLDFSLTSPGMGALQVNEDLTIQLLGYDTLKTNSKEAWFDRVNRIQTQITRFVGKYKPSSVYIENYSYGSTNGRETAGEVHGVVLFNLMHKGYPKERIHRNISPTGLKKFVTGNGNALKPDMVAWANKRFNLNLKISENDIADALAIAYVGFHINHFSELKEKMTVEQIEVVENILNPKPKKKRKPRGKKK